MKFGAYLRKRKGARSNAALAQEIGKSPAFVGQMLHGTVLPGCETLERLAVALGERDQLYLKAGKIPKEVSGALHDLRLWKLVRLLAKSGVRDKKITSFLQELGEKIE